MYLSDFNGFLKVCQVGPFFNHHAMAIRKPDIILRLLLLQVSQFEVSIYYQAMNEHISINDKLAEWLVKDPNSY